MTQASARAVTIGQVQTYIFAFDSLPDSILIASEPEALANVPVTGFGPGEFAELTAYESSLTNAPFFDANFGGGSRPNLALCGNAGVDGG